MTATTMLSQGPPRLDSAYDGFRLPPDLRLLYVPNGLDARAQPGLRRGFEELLAAGEIATYSAYGLQYETQASSLHEAWQKLLQTASDADPTVVLVQHVGDTRISQEMLARLVRAVPSATLVYHDCDAFGRGKRLSTGARAFIAASDLALGCGAGLIPRQFAEAGARRYDFVPHAFDEGRFGEEWAATDSREFDVVFIGNRNHSPIPGRSLPGSRGRSQLVRLLQRRFGRRAGIFGRGWHGIGAQGPVGYAEQTAVLRSAWLSVNWDYFPKEACYFSDRLPISLAAGVPHVTTHHPGYDQLLGDIPGLVTCASPLDAVAAAEQLLEAGQTSLRARGESARAFAMSHLGQGRQARSLLVRTIAATVTP